MKACFWNNELHGWDLSDSLSLILKGKGFEVREMSRQELLKELQAITRINQQKEIEDLYGDGEFFESIE